MMAEKSFFVILNTTMLYQKYLLHLVASSIFILFTLFALVVHLSGPEPLSSHDPYYHISAAEAIWEQKPMNLPQISSVGEVNPSLWATYHAYLAPFVSFAEESADSRIRWAKGGHSILVGAFFLVFFLVAFDILRNFGKNISKLQAIFYSAGGTVFVAIASHFFLYRIFLIRPHIFSIILTLLLIYAILRCRWGWAFIISAIYPIIYSASFLFLVPALITLPALWSYRRFISSERLCQSSVTTPFLTIVAGLLVGILLRPDAYDYLFNGLFIFLATIFSSFYIKTPAGAELSPPSSLTATEFLWFFPFIAVAEIMILNVIFSKKKRKTLSPEKWLLLWLSTGYFFLFLFSSRAIEYLVPIAALFLILTVTDAMLPLRVRLRETADQIQEQYPGVHKLIYDITTHFNEKTAKNSIKISIVVAATLYLLALGTSMSVRMHNNPPKEIYAAAASYLEEHTSYAEPVFHTQWSDYPHLVFFNTSNRYLMGMGPLFTYFENPQLYWLWYHIQENKNGLTCREPVCNKANSIPIHKAISDYFGARYVYVTKSQRAGACSCEKESYFAQDPHFTRVFASSTQDGRFHNYIYKTSAAPHLNNELTTPSCRST